MNTVFTISDPHNPIPSSSPSPPPSWHQSGTQAPDKPLTALGLNFHVGEACSHGPWGQHVTLGHSEARPRPHQKLAQLKWFWGHSKEPRRWSRRVNKQALSTTIRSYEQKTCPLTAALHWGSCPPRKAQSQPPLAASSIWPRRTCNLEPKAAGLCAWVYYLCTAHKKPLDLREYFFF